MIRMNLNHDQPAKHTRSENSCNVHYNSWHLYRATIGMNNVSRVIRTLCDTTTKYSPLNDLATLREKTQTVYKRAIPRQMNETGRICLLCSYYSLCTCQFRQDELRAFLEQIETTERSVWIEEWVGGMPTFLFLADILKCGLRKTKLPINLLCTPYSVKKT